MGHADPVVLVAVETFKTVWSEEEVSAGKCSNHINATRSSNANCNDAVYADTGLGVQQSTCPVTPVCDIQINACQSMTVHQDACEDGVRICVCQRVCICVR